MEPSSIPHAELLQLIAHDLKNPLTAVRVLADMLLDEAEGHTRDDLRDLVQAADQAIVQAEGLALVGRVQSSHDDAGVPRSLDQIAGDVCNRPAFAGIALTCSPTEPVSSGVATRALTATLLNSSRMQSAGVSLHVAGRQATLRHPGLQLPTGAAVALTQPLGARQLREMRLRSAAAGLWTAAATLNRHGGALHVEPSAAGLVVRLELPLVR